MSRYSPANLDVASLFVALSQLEGRTEHERTLDLASVDAIRAAKLYPTPSRPWVANRTPPPFSETPVSRPLARRGTSNRDQRGNTTDRRRRKLFLLERDGDGTWVACYACGLMLDIRTLTVDRIVPACQGGRYIRSNIRAACGACNSETGGALATRKG